MPASKADNYESGLAFNQPGELGSGGPRGEGEGFTGALGNRNNLPPSDKGVVDLLDRLTRERSPYTPEGVGAEPNPIRESQSNGRDKWPDPASPLGKAAVFNENLPIQPETDISGSSKDDLQDPNFLLGQAFGGMPLAGSKERDDLGRMMDERLPSIGERGDYREQLEAFLKNMPWLHRVPGVPSGVKTAGPPGEPIVEDPIDPDKVPAPNRERSSAFLGKIPRPPGDSTGPDYSPPGVLLGEAGPSILRQPATKVSSWVGLLPRYK